MKRIQYIGYGGPELMRVDDFELLAPGNGEVAVRVKFAAINPIDCLRRLASGKTGYRLYRMERRNVDS